MSHRRAKRIRRYLFNLVTIAQQRAKDGLPTQFDNLTLADFKRLYRRMKRAYRDQKEVV